MVQGLERIGKLGLGHEVGDDPFVKFELLSEGGHSRSRTPSSRMKEKHRPVEHGRRGAGYLFRAVPPKPCRSRTYDRIMNGDGTKAG